MIKKIRDFDLGFSERKKAFWSLGAVVFAIAWVILWNIFPMPWYSLFFASNVGANITFVLLAAVLMIPFCWAFSVMSACNLSVTKNTLVNVVFLVAAAYIFAIFRYSAVYLVILVFVLHLAAMVWVFGTAVPLKRHKVKRMKNKTVSHVSIPSDEPTEYDTDTVPIKTQPLVCVGWAALYTAVIEAAYLFLFYKIAYIFYS